MKKQVLFSILLISSFALFSFIKKAYNPIANTGIISENTFLDATEVTNLNWREYMSWHAQNYGKDSKEFLATTPDATVWKGEKFKPMRAFYLQNAAYNDYPVVGISHEQAVAYCTWRAARINELLKLRNKKTTTIYSCRLPTKVEWENITRKEAFSTQPYRTKFHNLQEVTDDGVVHENDITSPVKSFTPTLNGFHNLIGNVAEMVAEKGIAKGGSWQHTNIGLTYETDYTYSQPTNWIGFRCVLIRE